MTVRRLAEVGSLIVLGVVGGFCALEGVASLIVFAGTAVTYRPPSFNEQMHTTYDPDLGWAHPRNVFVPNLYGPGVFLRTNGQGFRGDHDVTPEEPKDRARVICSGDSFTLGYGVDDDHAWCARLAAIDRRLETVNMGQGGYGLDQSYLWYARDGQSLAHSVHVFALITDDFIRMERPRFLSFAKPELAVEDGKLVAKNVPVPKRLFPFFPKIVARLRPAV